MQRKSVAEMACGIAQALERIGDWWTLLIVRDALFGLRTFDEFRQSLGIPRNTLSARLSDMVEKGIFVCNDDPQDARRKLYSLTEQGRDLWVILLALQQWGNTWVYGPEQVPSYMADRKTMTPIEHLSPRARDGRTLTMEDVTMIEGPGAPPLLKALLGLLNAGHLPETQEPTTDG